MLRTHFPLLNDLFTAPIGGGLGSLKEDEEDEEREEEREREREREDILPYDFEEDIPPYGLEEEEEEEEVDVEREQQEDEEDEEDEEDDDDDDEEDDLEGENGADEVLEYAPGGEWQRVFDFSGDPLFRRRESNAYGGADAPVPTIWDFTDYDLRTINDNNNHHNNHNNNNNAITTTAAAAVASASTASTVLLPDEAFRRAVGRGVERGVRGERGGLRGGVRGGERGGGGEVESRFSSMLCRSCKDLYTRGDAGTCRECYEEAGETEEELRKEIEELRTRVAFLKSWAPETMAGAFTDAALECSDGSVIRTHKAVLASRSSVFKAMLESEMEESRSGTIKITDFGYEVLRHFVHYLYTAELFAESLEECAYDLLALAEKYNVRQLKTVCERYMTHRVSTENALESFEYANCHGAKILREAALSTLVEGIHDFTRRDEYRDLVRRDARLAVEIFEAYLAKQKSHPLPRL